VHDLVIRHATVVDGTGAPRRTADVAVAGGRIVAVERHAAQRGREELDATDLVVAPGFIDPHTHLDGNLFWDERVTPSSSYGVTTVVTGNCGYTMAPLSDATRDYVVAAMSTVEQIPEEAIRTGVPLDWTDLASYFARLRGLRTAVHHATLIGHVPLRAAVLGVPDVHERPATAEEIARMRALLQEGLALGALGFSTDQVRGNPGPGGTRLPGQVASRDELLALAAELARAPGPGLFAMAHAALLEDRAAQEDDLAWHEELATTSERPVVVGPIFDRRDDPGVAVHLLDLGRARRRPGIRVVHQISTRPFELWTRLGSGSAVLDAQLPSLAAARRAGGEDGVRALLRSPDGRRALREEAAVPRPTPVFSGRWDEVFVRYVARSEHEPYRDRSLGELAAVDAEGRAPVDVLADLALAEDLAAQFACVMRNGDEDQVARQVAHPAAMIGASDAGAHVLMNTDSCYAVWTLQRWVRERAALTLEAAVRKLTADQADLLGLSDRGRVAPGLAADLVAFDPDRVGTTGVRYVADQPAGGSRLVTDAVGIAWSLVNGTVVSRDGVVDGDARPGRFLTPRVGVAPPRA
jgi:N-acyl-D-aspartate/D-glutamate deacylase